MSSFVSPLANRRESEGGSAVFERLQAQDAGLFASLFNNADDSSHSLLVAKPLLPQGPCSAGGPPHTPS